MLLYYAVGGGLGHLVRARAFLHTLGLGGDAALFTTSRFADDARVTGGLPVVRVPPSLDGDAEGLRALLVRTLGELRVDRLVVDAFPAGLLGELAGLVPPPGVALEHVARLLRWEQYLHVASDRLPRYDATWVVEELHCGHRRALESASGDLRPLVLVDPPAPAPPTLDPPFTLVVHSGPDEETLDLVAFAREVARAEGGAPRLVLATPSRPAGLDADVVHLDVFPASGLFAGADRIVTAAGFNAVRQTEPYREKRVLVPYPRRFDDPFARAATARAAAPGPVAASRVVSSRLRASMPGAAGLLAVALAGSAPAATPSVAVEVFHAPDASGTVTFEVPGAPPCVFELRGNRSRSVACTVPLPDGVKALTLKGELRWKDGPKGTRVSKGTQSWKVLDVGPMAAPLRDASRPLAERMKGLLAARHAFEEGSGGLVEESEDRIEAGEKSPPATVKAAEKKLGYALPPGYASLVTGLGTPTIGDSYFERPEGLADAFEQMVKGWGTPRAALEKELGPGARALYRSGTILFTEVGDGYGGLLYRPAPVADCGGRAALSWFHQDDLRSVAILRHADGSCMDFPAALLRVLADQLFSQYDDTGGEGIVVDRSSPSPFRLKLVPDGGRPEPGFSLAPDWSRYE